MANAAEVGSMKSAPKGSLIGWSPEPGVALEAKEAASSATAVLKESRAVSEVKTLAMAENPMNSGLAAGLTVLSDLSTGTTLQGTAESGTLTASTAAEQAGKLNDLLVGHVLHVKRASLDSVAVVVRPDANTELLLDIRQRSGQIEVYLRCEPGNAAALQGDWDRLERSLAAQGARLAPLNEAPPQREVGLPRSNQPSPGQGEADTHRRSPRPNPVVLDDLPMVGSLTEPLRRRPVRSLLSARRGWELWA